MTTQHCKTCSKDIDLNDLSGINTNQCPECGNPIFPATFAALKKGTVFVPDKCPALWVKISNDKAVCVDLEDASFEVGETQGFNGLEVVYPY